VTCAVEQSIVLLQCQRFSVTASPLGRVHRLSFSDAEKQRLAAALELLEEERNRRMAQNEWCGNRRADLVQPLAAGRPLRGFGGKAHGAMNPAGRVRCNIMPIAKGYSPVSQALFYLLFICTSHALG
jgi:hypothetical protein